MRLLLAWLIHRDISIRKPSLGWELLILLGLLLSLREQLLLLCGKGLTLLMLALDMHIFIVKRLKPLRMSGWLNWGCYLLWWLLSSLSVILLFARDVELTNLCITVLLTKHLISFLWRRIPSMLASLAGLLFYLAWGFDLIRTQTAILGILIALNDQRHVILFLTTHFGLNLITSAFLLFYYSYLRSYC